MNTWEEVKIQIQKETQRVFQSYTNFKITETIELFEKVLTYPLNKPELKLDGLETRVVNSLEKILIEGLKKVDNLSYFPDFARVEPYLRKILYLTNPTKFNELDIRKSGFAGFINALDLNTNRIDFENTRIENLIGVSNFGEHLFRTYKLRNIESHQCESWTNRELYENIESVLVIYLFATNKCTNSLKPIVEQSKIVKEPDFRGYLESVKENFRSRIGKFIHIKGKEDIALSQSYVIENIVDQDSNKTERKGTVNELRKNQIPEKRMLIWGDAGMGKSTTLEYLAYVDADEKLKNYQSKLPVYLSLGLLTDKNISIKQSIFNKIGVDNSIGEKMLKEGSINLFLDAINEIPRDDNNQLKTFRYREIQNLLNDYKQMFIIISNRPQDENIFKGVSVFHLQKMDGEQIELFLKRNTKETPNLAKLLSDAIKKDSRLEKIIKTPLMLSRLIEIIKSKGEIPKSEGEIIDRFIFSLYQREKEEKKDANFNIKIIHRLLRYLGYESLERKDTNSGMTEDEVLDYFITCKNKYGFQVDTIYILETTTQLGILEQRDGMYTFAHQAYQDYFHAQEEKAILGL
ncbi:NACHT domain-containing protein [Pseudanabaena sp. FACHB-1998]|uniref:NACHT domain-containing protein n=1 Tax=Pseudanabaena sp. FACHB-1998 TaxID=2692858 RepID=UPI0016811990|nr:NACHT domain-containing protein [Pseudanabaena sp. FACHB-1998]